jgi:hypothetical protein
MRIVPVLAQLSILGMLSIALAPCAHADSTVNATDDIYAVGSQSGYADNSYGGSTGYAPTGIAIGSGVTSYNFSATVSSGTFTINNGNGSATVYNDPDGLGIGAAPTSSNTGLDSISGITAPGQGYLVGVFIGAGGPSGQAPSPLDFVNTSFSTLSPLLDQVFFIGDGLTGDRSGSEQTFYVPTGATELYLGISDALDYSGTPGAYGDNLGTYDVVVTPLDEGPSTTPEPSSLLLLGTGILGMAGMLRRKILAR